jgi:predicted NBD/HSP70 family sugar kinase
MSKRPPAGSPGLLRRLNSAAVLHAVREDGPASRAAIARATGLSKPTVNAAVEVLLEQGYLTEDHELASPSGPGRRPRLLRFASGLGHVLGIDIGANKVLVLAADLAGQVLATERRKTAAREATALLALVEDAAADALEAAGIPAASLKAVGVGTPGVVDPVSGRVTLAPQLAGWEGIELGARLEPAFGCPVVVDNEVRLSLLAERWRGAAQEIDDAFFVQIGIGIGGGVLFGGEVYRGAGGAAGEIGYLPLFDGEEPRHGLGPFEHAAGGTAFARLARRAADGRTTALVELAGGDPDAIDAETVFAATAAGDAVASEVLDDLLDRLARGIAAAIVVLDPATVIVGGGISRAGERLRAPLEEKIHALVPVSPRVILSQLGDEAVALGGVRLALQTVEHALFDFAALELV